jgi:hypothetical protein
MDMEKLNKALQITSAIEGLRAKLHVIEQFRKCYCETYLRQEGHSTTVLVPDELEKPILALIEDHYKSKLQELEQEFEEM